MEKECREPIQRSGPSRAGNARIPLRSEDEIAAIGRACRVVGLVLDATTKACQPGMTTADLATVARNAIDEAGGESLFRGYTRGGATPFPGDVCISVNEEVVHGIPGDRIIREGDVVKVDCGVRLSEWCGDGATTILVEPVADESRRLAQATRYVLDLAIDMMNPGVLWSDIARAMQTASEEAGFGVVTDYVGHGIGRSLHEPPKVPAFAAGWDWIDDFVLRPGMVLAVEPMLTAGLPEVVRLNDGWTVATRDRRPAAHEEHTIAVRDDGVLVLTGPRLSDEAPVHRSEGAW